MPLNCFFTVFNMLSTTWRTMAMFCGAWSLRTVEFIFVEDNIQCPVQRIFNSPVGAYRLSYLPGIGRQAADKETSLNADAPFDLARFLNHVCIITRRAGRCAVRL